MPYWYLHTLDLFDCLLKGVSDEKIKRPYVLYLSVYTAFFENKEKREKKKMAILAFCFAKLYPTYIWINIYIYVNMIEKIPLSLLLLPDCSLMLLMAGIRPWLLQLNTLVVAEGRCCQHLLLHLVR
jgi:hypothetical protein